MVGPMKTLMALVLFGLFTLVGCGGNKYAPVEPALNTGTVFQRSPQDVQTAARNALTKLNFAITKETEDYIEAVHLKPGETPSDNKSELFALWFKPREGSVLVLSQTILRASGVAKQKEWDQAVLSKMIQELQ